MTNPLRFLSLSLVAASLAAFSLTACTASDEGGPTGAAGTKATGAAGTNATGAAGTNATGTAGTNATGTAGTNATGAAGTNATGAAGTGAAGTGAAGTTAGAAGTGAGGTTAGAAGTGAGGTGAGKTPMCITENVADGVNRATTNYIECDVEDQGIDFDVAAAYDAAANGGKVRKPGYDPAMTPVSFTDYGTAFTGYAAQMCHPYCFKGNLTVGVEFSPATPAGLKGEVLFDFPTTGLNVPIAMAVGRASLGWIYLDGPALPAGATIQAQMVLKTKAKGVITANNMVALTAKKWLEFKYFPIQQGFAQADLVDVTSIGFRLTMGGTAAAWSGVVYADHFQLRK